MGLYTGGGLGSSGGSGSGLYRGTSTKAPAAPGPKPQGKSIFGRIAGGITGAIAGVPRGFQEIGREVVTAPLTLADELTRGAENAKFHPLFSPLENPKLIPYANQSRLGALRSGAPALASLGAGARQTGEELNPSGVFATLRKNYAKDPVGAFLNDAANVATVATAGAGAGAKLGIASEEGGRLARIGEVASKAAAAPLKPYEAAFKVPGVLGDKALQSATEAAAAGRTPPKLATVGSRLSAPAKRVTNEILQGKAQEQALADRQAQLNTAIHKIVPDKNEQQAMLVVAEHTARALAALRRSVPAAEFEKFVEARTQGTLSPQAAHIAADVIEGKAAPEVAARIQSAIRLGHEGVGGRAERTAEFMAKPGNEFQAGYEPNPVAVARASEKASVGLNAARRTAETARGRADQASLHLEGVRLGVPTTKVYSPFAGGRELGAAEQRATVLGNVARSAETRLARIEQGAERAKANASYAVENAPSRLKPVLAENRATVSHLTGVVNDLRRQGLNTAAAQVEKSMGKLPVSLQELQSAGINAEHFFHTSSEKPIGPARTGRAIEAPRVFTPGSEKLRTGSPVYERSLMGQQRGETEALVSVVRRQTAERIAQVPGAVEHLGEGALANASTLAEAKAHGYVPWNPAAMFDTQGNVRSLDQWEAMAGGQHPTMFMPKPLFDQFRHYFEPRRGELLGLMTDVPNRAFYMGRLALSPAFITGRLFGHALLAVAGTSDLKAFGHHLIDVVKTYKETGKFPEGVNPRILKGAATVAEFRRLQEDVAGKGGKFASAARGLNAGISKPFKLAGFLDNIQRSAFYMTELAKRGSDEAALTAALRAVGEFDKMTPFERDYVRRVIPMWAWHRELTKISFHLAEDHPLRIAWTLHLGSTVGKPDQPLPDFNLASIPLPGGKLLGTGMAFPFSETGSVGAGGLGGVGKLLGPVPKIALGSLTGENPNTGRPFSRPAGTGRGPKGLQPAAPSLFTQATNLFPQKGLIQGLTGQNKVARYSTGQPILTTGGVRGGPKRTIPTGEGRLAALTQFFGLPVTNRTQAEATAARQAKAGTKTKVLSTAKRRAGGGGMYR